jgi:hypothetical protein
VLLLNGLDASAGIAVAAFGLVAVATGTALGYFADRLPERPQLVARSASWAFITATEAWLLS